MLPFLTATETFHRTLAKQLRSNVHILDATRNATRPVHHAFKAVHGPVSTKAAAPCLAQHLAIAFHARSAVPKTSLAAINAQISVARSVRWTIVRYSLISKGRELTCLNSNPLAKWT
jgi:hypothetical protein